MVSSASLRICDAMLPALTSEFASSNKAVSATITAYAMAYGFFQLFGAAIGERIGKVRMIAVTCTIAGLISTATALASSLLALVVLRAAAGIAFAGVIPLSIAVVGDLVPYERRQGTLARFMLGSILGVILGQFLGGAITEALGWRYAFMIIGVGAMLAGGVLIGQSRHVRLPHHDPVLATASFYANLGAVLRSPWARLILIVATIEGFLVFGSFAFVPLNLHNSLGLSMTASSVVGLCFGLGAISYSVLAMHAARRFGERVIVIGGSGLLAMAFFLLMLHLGAAWAFVACYFVGLGFYMLHGTLQTHASQLHPTARGPAMGLFALLLFAGQSLGAASGAWLIEFAGFYWLFGIASLGLLALGLQFARALGRRKT